MKTILVLIATSVFSFAASSHAADDFKELSEVPKAFRTRLNLIPKGKLAEEKHPVATVRDCITVGQISATSFTLFGQTYATKLIKFSDSAELAMAQILGQSTTKETWLLTFTQLKSPKHADVLYLTIEPLSTTDDLDVKPTTYTVLPELQ